MGLFLFFCTWPKLYYFFSFGGLHSGTFCISYFFVCGERCIILFIFEVGTVGLVEDEVHHLAVHPQPQGALQKHVQHIF